MARIWSAVIDAVDSFNQLTDRLQTGAIVLALLLVAVGWLPSPRLIRRTLFPAQILGFVWALQELGACLITLLGVAPTHIVRRRSIRRAVRVWVEHAIFDPRPQMELHAFTPWRSEWRAAYRKRRTLASEWGDRRQKAIDRLIHGTGPVEIEVDTCFAILNDAAGEKIERYFDSLGDEGADDPQRFICHLVVHTAYAAPLHLVAGLVTHFNKDWVPVIDDFGNILARLDDPFAGSELRRAQAFIFNCWLMWGPSIPLCTCDRWVTGKIDALQLGYGDENNSISLISETPELLACFQTLQGRIGGTPARRGPQALALQVKVTGRPRWGPSVDKADVSSALQGVRTGLVLEYIEMSLFGGAPADMARLYYSAYLWVMFIIRGPDDRPVFPWVEARADGGEVWRGLVPFFEHGNIADGVTLDFMKGQLARKALAGLERLVERSQGWRFAYVCAFDDPACATVPGDDSRRFPEKPPGRQIRELIAERLTADFPGLAATNRVTVEPNTVPAYSACHLPGMIERYYATIDTASADQGDGSKALARGSV